MQLLPGFPLALLDTEWCRSLSWIMEISHRPIAFNNIDALLRLEDGMAKLYRFDLGTW